MVRAKIHCLRAHQPHLDATERARLLDAFRDYLKLAAGFTVFRRPSLVVMHGLSGSGKSVVSHALLQSASAIRIRSDVERKRLHKRAPSGSAASGVGSGIYTGEATQRVYRRLAQLAREILAAGYNVILDAAFLRRWQRDLMRNLARELGVPFSIASLQAAETVLQTRILHRSDEGTDASDADLAVLSHELAAQDTIAEDERAGVITLDAALPLEALAATAEWRALLEKPSY
jgi:predicted kinase